MTGFVPAEWSPHRAMWVGWPSHPDLWEDNLEPAQAEVEALVKALAGPGREKVRLLVGTPEALEPARTRFEEIEGVEVIAGRFGDIWLRDTGPIFGEKSAAAAAFRFNGWGGKYELEFDDTVADQIAEAAGTPLERFDFVIEGGALDHDGEGAILTTKQCLLNKNRNADWTREAAQGALSRAFQVRKVLWLGDGLFNDHTDGHVDNLARFVAPGVVACPISWGPKDPNAEVYDETARLLSEMTDAQGRPLKLLRVPSPGLVVDADERPAPASHMNFVIANGAVIVPTYGDKAAADFAVKSLKTVFKDREVIALPSTAILSGGGSFHCITQQEPE